MAPDTAHPGITVNVTRSEGADGAVLVLIDTTFEPDGSDGGPALRVLINDHPAYTGKEYESGDSRGIVPERALEVRLTEIEYEHPHDYGDYSDVN